MLVPYERISEGYYCYYKRLHNLTGKWKVTQSSSGVIKVHIEAKGLIFKRWITEDNIEWMKEEREFINECGS